MALEIRETTSDADLEAWRSVRAVVLPNERALSIEAMRAQATPETIYLLAELDGELAGSGFGGRSSFQYAGLYPRVLPEFRGRGIGTALLERLATHAVASGFTEAGSMVEDDGSLAFAGRFGFAEVDRQVEQVRAIGAEPRPTMPDGIRVVTVAERPDLWPVAYDPFALEAIADMALYRPIVVSRDQWERDWVNWPEATFLALDGDDTIVGCAGLERDADRDDRAEQALTAVARAWRRHGLATALKELTLAAAADHGIREVYTWTQRDNVGMRALNERLGYTMRSVSITLRAPLPLAASRGLTSPAVSR
jgi:mycothiol synthase